MKNVLSLPAVFLVMVAVAVLVSGPAAAQEKPKAATSAADISVEELELLLKPLMKEKLKETADVWAQRLEEKGLAISEAEIQKAGAEALAGLKKDHNALLERFNAVFAALKAKGGEVEVYEKQVAVASEISGGEMPKDPSAIWTAIVEWVTSNDGGIKWALNILKFIVILVVFKILASVLAGITNRAVSKIKKTSDLLRDFFVNTIRKVTVLIGFIIAMSALGIDIGPLLAGIGVMGFVIGFALQGTLSNFACGIMILIYRPYDIGNVVSVGGVTGKVDAMTLVSTTVMTPDNQQVIVPNSKIWGDVITNVTGKATRRVDLVFGIGYGDDIAKAQKILEEVVSAHELVLDDPKPVIRLHQLADSSVNFVVRPWSKTSDYWAVYWDLTRAVKERFDAEGISIPFPQRDVHIYQESQPSAT